MILYRTCIVECRGKKEMIGREESAIINKNWWGDFVPRLKTTSSTGMLS